MDRRGDLVRFYNLMDRLARRLGGPRRLAQCTRSLGWPERGVYFFFEPNEVRSDSGVGPRVVRVGTHAITGTSNSSLWSRLSQHRGSVNGKGGNHRGSIFRRHVGAALQAKFDVAPIRSWGLKQDLGHAARALGKTVEDLHAEELRLEIAVSTYIGALPFLWIDVPDAPGPQCQRATIERGAIALLSNWRRPVLDPRSAGWLGLRSDREQVRGSGLWNIRNVDETYDPAFLTTLEERVDATDLSRARGRS